MQHKRGGECVLNSNMLKGKLVERGITIPEISNKLNINQSTFYRKMKRNSFKIFETDIIMKTLQLTPLEASKIFFAEKSHKCDKTNPIGKEEQEHEFL